MKITHVAEIVKLSHVAEIVKLTHVARILEAASMYDHFRLFLIFKKIYNVLFIKYLVLKSERSISSSKETVDSSGSCWHFHSTKHFLLFLSIVIFWFTVEVV